MTVLNIAKAVNSRLFCRNICVPDPRGVGMRKNNFKQMNMSCTEM